MQFIPITVELAHKWLNTDVYWESPSHETLDLILASFPDNVLPRSKTLPHIPRKDDIINIRQKLRKLNDDISSEENQNRTEFIDELIKSKQVQIETLITIRKKITPNGVLTTDEEKILGTQEKSLQDEIARLKQQRHDAILRQRNLNGWQKERETLRKKYAGQKFYFDSTLTLPEDITNYYYPLSRRSDLRDDGVEHDLEKYSLTEQIALQIRNALLENNYITARANIEQLDQVCERLNKPRQTAEARLEIAIAFYKMREYDRALFYLTRSLLGYRGTDPHAEALTRWIMGWIQWETPATVPEAMVNWRKCYEMFASVGGERRTFNNANHISKWYRVRANLMNSNLETAIRCGRPQMHSATAIIENDETLHTKTNGDIDTPTPAAKPATTETFATAQPTPPPTSPSTSAHAYSSNYFDVGDTFWWVSASEGIRVTLVVRKGSSPCVSVELVNGKLFAAQGNIPAGNINSFSLSEFEHMISSDDLRYWTPIDFTPDELDSSSEELNDDLANELWQSALLRFDIPIYESIRANPSGGGDWSNTYNYVEIDQIKINSRPYCLFSVKSNKVITINFKRQYRLISVEGNSLNQVKPHPIIEGDYVLIRINQNPGDGQIVATKLIEPIANRIITLKVKRGDGLYSESSTDYDVVPLKNVHSYVGEVIAVAKPL